MRRVRYQSLVMLGSLAAVLAFTAGCSKQGEDEAGMDGDPAIPSPVAAREILQASFDTYGECTPFFDLPHDVARNADYDRRQLQAFVDAGLLSIEGEKRVTDPAAATGQREVVRYRATPEGMKTFRSGTGALAGQKTILCYGTRKVEDVDVGAPDVLGTRVSVTYRYRLEALPGWARSPSIAAAYPSFGKFLAGVKEDHATLIRSDDIWKLEGPPSTDMFDFRQLGR